MQSGTSHQTLNMVMAHHEFSLFLNRSPCQRLIHLVDWSESLALIILVLPVKPLGKGYERPHQERVGEIRPPESDLTTLMRGLVYLGY